MGQKIWFFQIQRYSLYNGKSLGDRNTPSAAYAMLSPDFHFDKKSQQWIGGHAVVTIVNKAKTWIVTSATRLGATVG
jgi:hypothetical protein